MKNKEFFQKLFAQYFIIVTLINVSTFVLGSIFRPNDTFGYDAFLSPLIYGLISLVPAFFSNSSKERTLKQEIVRQILQLIMIEILLIVFAFGMNSLVMDNIALIAGFATSVFVIYVLVVLISWFLDLRTAKQMNEDLLAFQSKEG